MIKQNKNQQLFSEKEDVLADEYIPKSDQYYADLWMSQFGDDWCNRQLQSVFELEDTLHIKHNIGVIAHSNGMIPRKSIIKDYDMKVYYKDGKPCIKIIFVGGQKGRIEYDEL